MRKLEPKVFAIHIAQEAGTPMRSVVYATALKGAGLEGDRYANGKGSFNKVSGIGNRQVTLMNAAFFEGSGFYFDDARRNIFVTDFELMDHIGHEFGIGDAVFRGVAYCDPCDRPSNLSSKSRQSFKDTFFDRGGLIAEVISGGVIQLCDPLTPRKKGY